MSWAGTFRSSIVTRKAGPSRSPRSWLSSSRLAQRSSSPSTPQNAVAVHAAAPTVPLVFVNVADPVALGLVESLAHPGGNVTGFATLVPEGFVGKQLQFLKDLVPQASRIAVLINPTNPIHQRERPKLPEIGRLLGVELVVVEASKPDQFETAFETAHTQGAEAINVFGDPLFHFTRRRSWGSPLAIDCRRCTWLGRAYWTADSCPMVRTNSTSGVALATYVDKILKGEKPGDLPVEQPTRFYLIVNLKTAAALGITVPPSILAQADEVIRVRHIFSCLIDGPRMLVSV